MLALSPIDNINCIRHMKEVVFAVINQFAVAAGSLSRAKLPGCTIQVHKAVYKRNMSYVSLQQAQCQSNI